MLPYDVGVEGNCLEGASDDTEKEYDRVQNDSRSFDR